MTNPMTDNSAETELLALAERFPEINPNNYNEDDVIALNNWGCEVFDALRSTAATVSRDREAIDAAFSEHIRLVPVDPDAYARHGEYIDNTDDNLAWKVKPESKAAFLDAILSLTPIGSGAEAMREAKRLINERLEDLETANELYGKDQRLNAPEKIERNKREASWLKDLRSILSPVLVQLVQTRCVQPVLSGHDGAEAKSGIADAEREAFKRAYTYLDHTEDKDAWGRPKFMHSHVDAMWAGWKRRSECGGAA